MLYIIHWKIHAWAKLDSTWTQNDLTVQLVFGFWGSQDRFPSNKGDSGVSVSVSRTSPKNQNAFVIWCPGLSFEFGKT